MTTDEPDRSSRREWPGLEAATGPMPVETGAFFSGRAAEMNWLADRVLRRRTHTPIFISGLAGVGKTSLLRIFFASHRTRGDPVWINLEMSADPMTEASAFAASLREDRDGARYVGLVRE